MTKNFGNLGCADIVCRKIVYIYTFVDEKRRILAFTVHHRGSTKNIHFFAFADTDEKV